MRCDVMRPLYIRLLWVAAFHCTARVFWSPTPALTAALQDWLLGADIPDMRLPHCDLPVYCDDLEGSAYGWWGGGKLRSRSQQSQRSHITDYVAIFVTRLTLVHFISFYIF